MTTEHTPDAAEAYFAPTAFEAARLGYVAIRHDVEQLQSVADMAADRFDLTTRREIDESVLLYRIARSGFRGQIPDKPLTKVPAYASYIPASQLSLDVDDLPVTATKAHILGQGQPLEIDVQTFDKPLVTAFARSLVFPSDEDERLIASPGAWLQQARQAFSFLNPSTTDTPAVRQQLIDDALKRYPQAIVLEPRRDA